jgi:WhiB family redox-sensing transcriptional regulator
MAEMAPVPFVDNVPTVNTVPHDSRPHLELVEPMDERPPRLTTDEADYLLGRGPYAARLRATQRILSAAVAFAKDEETAEIIGERYLKTLAQDVIASSRALIAYDKQPPQAPIESVPTSYESLGEHAVKVVIVEEQETEEVVPGPNHDDSGRYLRQAQRIIIAKSRPDPFAIDVRSGGTKISKNGETITADNWNQFSACVTDHPDAMFVRGAQQHEAKVVCLGCDVRRECLSEALSNKIEWGVWGGMTERERRALLRKNNWQRIFEPAEKPR